MGLPIGQGCPPLHAHARRAGPSRSCNRSTGMACLFCRQQKCFLQNKQFRRKKFSAGTPPAARVISPLHNLWASPQAKIPRSFRALFLDRAANKRSAAEPPIKRVLCTLAGTVRRCRRRISETYRTYGTYRTKADRMANFFSADLLWCGSRPPIQRIKKTSDYASSASHLSLMSQMSHLSGMKSSVGSLQPGVHSTRFLGGSR